MSINTSNWPTWWPLQLDGRTLWRIALQGSAIAGVGLGVALETNLLAAGADFVASPVQMFQVASGSSTGASAYGDRTFASALLRLEGGTVYGTTSTGGLVEI
jgi:hypothetical protein